MPKLFPLLLISTLLLAGCGGSELPPSHAIDLDTEFSMERASDIDNFEDDEEDEDWAPTNHGAGCYYCTACPTLPTACGRWARA